MDDYLRRLSAEAATEEPTADASAAAAKEVSAKDRRRVEAQERQRKSVRERPLREAIASLEARIAALETAQKAREAQLVDPAFYADFAQSKPVLDAHRVAKAELEVLYGEWEDRQKRLAQLGADG
jgi:ATP-binding cassette subfamily F protein 3